VTGGSGFVGSRIIEELCLEDAPISANEIINLDINDPATEQCTYVHGDISNYSQIADYFHGVEIVFHTAAIIDWGTKPEQIVYDVNVTGTENVIRACREHGVRVLVYCSSLDAVFEGKPLIEIDESHPYPDSFPNVYCKSKAEAEKLILQADGSEMHTCILRPSDIYGEGDPYHIDPILKMAQSGFYVRLGNGTAKSQHIYVGNMAWAQLLAAKSLLDGNEKVNGSIYFITDGRHNFFKFFDQIVIGAGYRIFPKNLWIPKSVAYAIGAVSEFIAWLWRPIKHYNPGFSRFAVVYTCTDFTFSSAKAKKDFGYYDKYNPQLAVVQTARHYLKPKPSDRIH